MFYICFPLGHVADKTEVLIFASKVSQCIGSPYSAVRSNLRNLDVIFDQAMYFDQHIKSLTHFYIIGVGLLEFPFHLPQQVVDSRHTHLIFFTLTSQQGIRILFMVLIFTQRAPHGQAHEYISDLLHPYSTSRSLRSSGLLVLPRLSYKLVLLAFTRLNF